MPDSLPHLHNRLLLTCNQYREIFYIRFLKERIDNDTINQLKLQIPHTEEALEKKIQKTLHLKKGDSFTYRIHRQSLDARRKPELFYVYTVDVTVSNENAV